MKIALAQLNPKVGDFENNLAKARAALEKVAADAPDLVVFPELFLTGYPPLDYLEKPWFIARQRAALADLAAASAAWPDLGVVVGAALQSGIAPGRGLSNAAVLIQGGRVVFTQAKTLLPTYDVFDEARYFDPAREIRTVAFKDRRLGLCVCEDAWNEEDFWPTRLYDLDPVAELNRAGADLLINISASPFHVGKDELRHRLIKNHARRHGRPFVFVNQVGGNDELIFDGRSLVFDASGELIAELSAFSEAIVVVDLDVAHPAIPFVPQDPVESIHQALLLGIRDYLGKSGFSTAVVGLSGGIDSAVTFTLAAQALGRENVLGVLMPSMYSSEGSVEDSKKLAENLGAAYRIVPIEPMYDAYLAGLAEHFEGRPPDVTEENIQARVRGNILMAFSNKFGHIVLTTGNKSELAMGYCTLYGDMSGGLAVISDLPKMMVYELARYINRNGEIIPAATIDKPPSAELRPGQKDEDSLPPYSVLDQIVKLYVEDHRSVEEIAAAGFDGDLARWVVKTLNRNEYKRKQAAPGLKVTSKAFGIGRRMPIVARHDW